MNNQEYDNSQSFDLPAAKPSGEVQDFAAENSVNSNSPEIGNVANMEKSGNLSQPISVPPPQKPAPVAGDDQAYASSGAFAAVPQIADDTDLIEKEWVMKAKEIVAKTAHDPYLQNKELTKFKAEYMRKRYNKDLVQGEDD